MIVKAKMVAIFEPTMVGNHRNGKNPKYLLDNAYSKAYQSKCWYSTSNTRFCQSESTQHQGRKINAAMDH